MNLDKKRWLILALSCLTNLCIGSVYAWSVFASPMAMHLSEINGSEITSLAIIFTIANSVGPITMITGGMMTDKIGPRGVIVIGGLLFGAGMIFSGFAISIPMLMITYGLGVGLGSAMVYGCSVSNSVKWFPDKKGFAGGITTASYGISSVMIPIVANQLISNYGITMTFKILGIVMMLIIGGCALVIDKCPSGYKPVNYIEVQTEKQNNVEEKNWKQMIADQRFLIMLAMLCCGAFSGLMITSQASIIAQRMMGMTVVHAALIVSILALFNTGGRICAGILSDKIGAIKTISLVFIVLMVGQTCLLLSNMNRIPVFCVGIMLIGFCFGSIMGIYPGFTASQFGSKNNGVNYGIMFIGFALAGFFGPTIMAEIYEKTNVYSIAFLVAIALGFIGFLLSVLFMKMLKNK